MAKNNPLKSWMPKIRPKHDPKFHQELKLTGVAKSIKLPLRMVRNGPLVRNFVNMGTCSDLLDLQSH